MNDHIAMKRKVRAIIKVPVLWGLPRQERLLSARKASWNSLCLGQSASEFICFSPPPRPPPETVLHHSSLALLQPPLFGLPWKSQRCLLNIEIRWCSFLVQNLLTSSHFTRSQIQRSDQVLQSMYDLPISLTFLLTALSLEHLVPAIRTFFLFL